MLLQNLLPRTKELLVRQTKKLLESGQNVPTFVLFYGGQKRTKPNIVIATSGAGQCSTNYVQVSAAVGTYEQ